MSQVIGADRDAIDAGVDELVHEDDIGWHFHHHPQLEVCGLGQTKRSQAVPGLFQFLDRAHKGYHHPEIGEVLSHSLQGLYFQLEDFGFLYVARTSPVTQHGVLFRLLILLTAFEVTILIGLEIGGAVDHGPGVEGLGKGVQTGSELVNELLATLLLDHVSGVLAYIGDHELRSKKSDSVHVAGSHLLSQVGVGQVHIELRDGLYPRLDDSGCFHLSMADHLTLIDLACVAVHGDQLFFLEYLGSSTGPHHARYTQFPGDYGGMASPATTIGDDGGGSLHGRYEVGRGHLSHQDLALLQVDDF